MHACVESPPSLIWAIFAALYAKAITRNGFDRFHEFLGIGPGGFIGIVTPCITTGRVFNSFSSPPPGWSFIVFPLPKTFSCAPFFAVPIDFVSHVSSLLWRGLIPLETAMKLRSSKHFLNPLAQSKMFSPLALVRSGNKYSPPAPRCYVHLPIGP